MFVSGTEIQHPGQRHKSVVSVMQGRFFFFFLMLLYANFWQPIVLDTGFAFQPRAEMMF